jgi:hypothetical protein
MCNVDWKNIPSDIAREIARHGELRVNALMTVAIAADQRAMTFASSMAAAATATLAAGIASVAASTLPSNLFLPCMMATLCFWIACVLSAMQARPNLFFPPGNHPKNLYGDAEYLAGPLSQSLGWDAENYQEIIEQNEACLKKNGRLMKAAIWIAALAPVAAGATWAVSVGRVVWVG